MEELIKVFKRNDKELVSARELHRFLEIRTPYTQWFERMIEYGFIENQDFVLVSQKCETNNPKNPWTTITDHAITLDMAKELCMTQKNEYGKRARKYFIERDKKLSMIEDEVRKQINNGHIGGAQSKEFMKYPHAYVDELMYKSSVLGGKEAYQLAHIIYECGVEAGSKRRT